MDFTLCGTSEGVMQIQEYLIQAFVLHCNILFFHKQYFGIGGNPDVIRRYPTLVGDIRKIRESVSMLDPFNVSPPDYILGSK